MSINGFNGTPFGLEADGYGQTQELIACMIAGVRTALPVRVVSVTNSGSAAPIGRVDIQPLVGQLDGRGKHVDHGTIYNVPYLRIQGGQNAIIIDPAVGDIGIAVFCDRDISGVKRGRRTAPPASSRKHDMSDAIYLHSVLSAAPSQYIAFQNGGIVIKSPNAITIDAPNVAIAGGGLTHNGVNIGSTHVHGGIAPGPSTTSTPR